MDRTVFEPSKFMWESTPGVLFKEVKTTRLVIPDEWPEFPMTPGTYYFAITARDAMMNQSDPLILEATLKFTPPPAPPRGGIRIIY